MNRMRIRGLASPVVALCMVAAFVAGCGELTGPTSPSTPVNVTATLLTGTSVKVSWSPSPQNDGVISYSVYRNGTKVGESTTTSYTDTGLSPQQTYRYTVAANCTSGLISDQSAETAAATVTTLDITPPTVVSHLPLSNATGVSPSATITVVFSEPMDPTTINATTITLKVTSSGAAIPGTVVFTPATRTAVLTPASSLPNPVNITATVTTGAKDLAGNGLAAPVSWSFTTVDQTPPTVLSTQPANGATAPPSVVFVINFSEAMDPATINATNITLKATSSGAAVAGNVNYNTSTNIASFTPNQTLAQNTSYTLTISGAVKDLAGNQMGTPVAVTISTLDVTPPTVLSTVPADGATGVSPIAPITAKFSEPMDINSINSTTFTLKTTSGSTPVSGTVTFDNASSTATFTPSSSLSNQTSYTATITTGVKDVSGNAMVANKVWTFTTTDVTAPTVTSVSPLNGATNIATTTAVQVAFSEPMDPLTINGTTVSLKNTGTSAVIPATLVYNTGTNSVTLTPSGPLSNSTNYTVVVTTGAKDVAGNGLASQFTSTFTTIPVPDTTAPTIITRSPANGATGVATNTAVTVQFSEAMDQSTINTTNIKVSETVSGNAVAGALSYSTATNTATFTPTAALSNNISYTVTVTTGVKDVAGNALAAQSVTSFTTVPDTTAPTIIANTPLNNATNVPVGSTVTVTFNEAMDATTINGTNIKLNITAGAAVAGTVSYNTSTHVATFTPSASLTANTNYTATVTTGVKDAAGNPLAFNATFAFKTAP